MTNQHQAALLELLNQDNQAPVANLSQRYHPFALTEIQKSYLLGRNPELPLGGTACQFYYELDCPSLSLPRYQDAWRKVINRHDMLRAVILDNGEQQVLAQVPEWQLEVHASPGEGEQERVLQRIRRKLAQPRSLHQWPLFDVQATPLSNGHIRVHIQFDLMIADQQSFLIILDEIARCYDDDELTLPPLQLTWRDYLARVQGEPENASDKAYWQNRVAQMPAFPSLPLAKPLEQLKPEFHRLRAQLAPEQWQVLQQLAQRQQVTPSTLLLTVFSEVLALHSANPHFCLNMTLFDRRPLHAEVDKLVGDFTNTMLFEVDFRSPCSTAERLKQVQSRLWQDLEHSSYQGTKVLADISRAKGQLAGVLMPVVFTSTLTQTDKQLMQSGAAQPGEPVLSHGQTAQVFLDNQITELQGQLLIQWDVLPQALPGHLMDQLFHRFTQRLFQLAETPEQIRQDPLAQTVLPQAGQLAPALAPVDTQEYLHSAWFQQLRLNPDRPALLGQDESWTYLRLGQRVAGYCRRLLDQVVSPATPVVIMLEKGAEQIAATLAVLCAHASYVPLDISSPLPRLQRIIADVQPGAIITSQALAGDMSRLNIPVLVSEQIADSPVDTLPNPTPGDQERLAYVIYTSGSTGEPKGVMISHLAALTTIKDINARFAINKNDRVLALSALHFDLSVFDIFAVLGVGGALVLPFPEQSNDPASWSRLCHQHGVTVWNTVPALWAMAEEYWRLQKTPPTQLRLCLLSGDWIPVALAQASQAMLPELELISLGGATEAAIWSIWYPVRKIDPQWSSIPYGSALGGQQVYVLDDNFTLARQGFSGEIYISGHGLADGYFNDPQKTSDRFIQHPQTGLRLYRTGDLGRYLDQGLIEFLGRCDHQVKINGYRVECGEISTLLEQHPQVERAHVLALGPRGKQSLAAFVQGADEGLLAPWLKQHVPSYMQPSRWQRVNHWPLTANGKLDRQALSTLLPEVKPGSATLSADGQQQLLEIVAELLELSHVAPQDNLVSLGATSVHLISLVNRLEGAFGQRLRLTDVARCSNLAAVFALLEPNDLLASSGDPEQLRAQVFLTHCRSIMEPEQRRLFKQQKVAWSDRSGQVIALGDQSCPELIRARRSWRNFQRASINNESLGILLSRLRQHQEGAHSRHTYGSAGGLYPIQVYGCPLNSEPPWYYHPGKHCLYPLAETNSQLDLVRFSAANHGWIEDTSLLLVLVLDMAAIAPIYEAASIKFGWLEAGAICQLIESQASDSNLGFCQVGDANYDQLREILRLRDGQVCLHTLAGGPVSECQIDQSRAQEIRVMNHWDEGEL